jgi:radical SAM superfamily enzyme YgiQ (UPF0313 family)
MKILIISANTLPASPAGPAYMAGAALRGGHTVEVFETLFSTDVVNDIDEHVRQFNPDVIGISIRLVNGYVVDELAKDFELGIRPFDARPMVKGMVDRIKQRSDAQIVLGGPGFNYFGQNWLEYLDLDYGLRGEADHAFPLFLERLEEGADINSVPGCIYRQNGRIHKIPRDLVADLDSTAFPAYELFNLARYREYGISPAITSKRGCAFGCTFCPYSSLEGTRYRLKSPGRVVDEIEQVLRVGDSPMIIFCENSFNVPKSHAEAICHEILARKLSVCWGTGALKPLKITDEFIQLMRAAGCEYINIAIESASSTMLKGMNRRYKVDDVREALNCFARSDMPYGISLMFGCPGETPETIAETLEVIDSFPVPPDGVWVTIGICLWTERQAVVEDARQAGQLVDDEVAYEEICRITAFRLLWLRDSTAQRRGVDRSIRPGLHESGHVVPRGAGGGGAFSDRWRAH